MVGRAGGRAELRKSRVPSGLSGHVWEWADPDPRDLRSRSLSIAIQRTPHQDTGAETLHGSRIPYVGVLCHGYSHVTFSAAPNYHGCSFGPTLKMLSVKASRDITAHDNCPRGVEQEETEDRRCGHSTQGRRSRISPLPIISTSIEVEMRPESFARVSRGVQLRQLTCPKMRAVRS